MIHSFRLFALLGFLNLVAVTFSDSASAKYRICTVTINSKDEAESFKKSLNPADFEFTELTTLVRDRESKASDAWFKEACEQGIQCDVLVVSGHFGGQFTGSSDLTWSLEKMEEASCRRSCDGILRHPKEVYLFGCNTLGTKGRERRSREEYLRVLIDHVGLSASEAERHAAAQYGPFGSSYKDRIERVFEGVHVIFGFNGVGPSGQNVKASLANYFRRIGDYKKHLDLNRPNSLSKIWLDTMIAYNRELGQGLQSDHPTYQVKANMCQLNDEGRPLSERLALAVDLMGREPILYLPNVSQFAGRFLGKNRFGSFDDLQLVDAQIIGLEGRQDLKNRFESTLRSEGVLPSVKVDILSAERNLSWISQQEFATRMKEIFSEHSKNPSTVLDADFLCSQLEDNQEFSNYFEVDHFKNYEFNKGFHYRILGCVASASEVDPTIAVKAIPQFNRFQSTMTIEDRVDAIAALLKLRSDAFERQLEEIVRNLFNYRGPFQKEVKNFAAHRMLRFLKGSEQVKIADELLSQKDPDLYGISESLSRNPHVEESVLRSILNKSLSSKGSWVSHKWILNGRSIVQDWLLEHLAEVFDRDYMFGNLVPILVSSPQNISDRLKTSLIERLEQLTPKSKNVTWVAGAVTVLDYTVLEVEDLQRIAKIYARLGEEKSSKSGLRHLLFSHGRNRIQLDPTVLTGPKVKERYMFDARGGFSFSGQTYFEREPEDTPSR